MEDQLGAQQPLNGETLQAVLDAPAVVGLTQSTGSGVAAIPQQSVINGATTTRVGQPPNSVTPQKRRWYTSHITAMVVITGVLAGIDIWITTSQPALRLVVWLCYVVLLLSFIALLGHGIKGRWSGALIDNRNKISLSRLQTVLWTVLVLSAFLTAAQTNISFVGPLKGMQIALPEQLWMLMGISVASLIGTPLIQSYKKDNDKIAVAKTVASPTEDQDGQGVDKDDSSHTKLEGVMVVNTNDKFARWSDMFKGEEKGNQDVLDLGKVQMFCFTILLILAYAIALGFLFNDSARAISTFPPIDTTVVALLGVSHIGYLGNKATPHTAQSQ